MTWSPFRRLVTSGPTSTTTPAPSWPRIEGKSPSGSAPERVKSSVWQMPVALISMSTSPALGPSRSTSTISSGLPAAKATAARVFMEILLGHDLRIVWHDRAPATTLGAADASNVAHGYCHVHRRSHDEGVEKE